MGPEEPIAPRSAFMGPTLSSALSHAATSNRLRPCRCLAGASAMRLPFDAPVALPLPLRGSAPSASCPVPFKRALAAALAEAVEQAIVHRVVADVGVGPQAESLARLGAVPAENGVALAGSG